MKPKQSKQRVKKSKVENILKTPLKNILEAYKDGVLTLKDAIWLIKKQ